MSIPNYTCSNCGKRFYLRYSKLISQTTHCCSLDCSRAIRSTRISDALENQYNIKGLHREDTSISPYGYILVRCPTHPLRSSDNMVFAHRLIIEEDLRENDPGSIYLIEVDGQLVLSPEYTVHHIDGNKVNNSLGNLTLCSLGDHSGEGSIGLARNEGGSFKSIRSRISSGTLSRANVLDAGQDVTAAEDVLLRADSRVVVGTGLHVDIAEGSVGLLWSRSGLSAKFGIEVGAGCIDSGYVGEVKVVLYNHSPNTYLVKKGDRIAQLLTIPVSLSNYIQEDELGGTARGTSGLGSTGI